MFIYNLNFKLSYFVSLSLYHLFIQKQFQLTEVFTSSFLLFIQLILIYHLIFYQMILFLHLMIIQLNHRLIILYNNFLDQLSTFLQTIHRHHYRLLNFHLRNHQLSCYSYYCLIMKYYYPKIILYLSFINHFIDHFSLYFYQHFYTLIFLIL